jgi:hypothetical protein
MFVLIAQSLFIGVAGHIGSPRALRTLPHSAGNRTSLRSHNPHKYFYFLWRGSFTLRRATEREGEGGGGGTASRGLQTCEL